MTMINKNYIINTLRLKKQYIHFTYILILIVFRIEKGLMAFGWGRWEEVLSHAQLRKGWTNKDVEVTVSVLKVSVKDLEKSLKYSCLTRTYKKKSYYMNFKHKNKIHIFMPF